MDPESPLLVGVDAGGTKSVAIAVTAAGARVGRAEGPGANPKRHGLDAAADRISTLVSEAAAGAGDPARQPAPARHPAPARQPALLFVAGAGIDRPEHARALAAALATRLGDPTHFRASAGRHDATRVVVANDTLAVLRAGTPDGVGLAVPVSTGGNVIGRGRDGQVTDRGHGIFGGGYVLGALAARAARANRRNRVGPDLALAIDDARLEWRTARRPAPEAALLGAAVAAAAQHGDPFPARMVDRWCARVTRAVAEEVERLALGGEPAVIVYGGLADASPWLADRIRAAVLAGAPGARIAPLAVEPAEGAALLALDAWRGAPIRWDFRPRR